MTNPAALLRLPHPTNPRLWLSWPNDEGYWWLYMPPNRLRRRDCPTNEPVFLVTAYRRHAPATFLHDALCLREFPDTAAFSIECRFTRLIEQAPRAPEDP